MKTLTKIAVLLLALLMLVPCLAACGGGDETTAPGGDNGGNNGGGNGSSSYPLPPNTDLQRYQYNAYVRSQASGNGGFYTEDFWIDPAVGSTDSLSYAVLKRNKEIETNFKCSIRMTPSAQSSQTTEMEAFFKAEQEYELAILVAVDAAVCAQRGLLSDLKAGVNSKLNLNHQAFDQNIIEQMTLSNNLYYLSGDMNISAMDNTISTVFNTELFNTSKDQIVEKLGDEMYGDVYQMVADGNFTIDNMLKIAEVVTHDAKPDDGELRFDKSDVIGYYEYIASPLYYYYGCGMRLSSNEGHYPSLDVLGDEQAAIYDYLFDKLNTVKNKNIPAGASSGRGQNFKSGSVLFADFLLWDIRRDLYKDDADIAYGILPIPCKEENDPYLSVVYFQTCCHLWSIPYKRANKDNAAFMMYVMAAYSGKPDSTMEAYYYKTMCSEVARDDGSRASLDIIRGALVFDIALLYTYTDAGNGWGNYDDMLLNIVGSSAKQYDTYTDGPAVEKAEQDIQDTIDSFVNNSEGDGN